MWINYQFIAVCPFILNFSHISSQKWLVFGNNFGLPNFLPQLPNFFTRIYPTYPWHFPTLLASGRSSFDGRVNRIKSCSGQWTDKPGGDTWPTKVTTEQHLFWILYRSTSVSWGAKTSTNMIDLSKIQNFTSIDVYHRQCNWTLNIYVSLYITHLMVMTMLVKMMMKMVTWQKQTWRQDPDQGPGFWPEISWINWKEQFWPKPALKPFLSLVYL